MQHRQSERHLRTLGNTKNAAAAPIHRDGGGRKKGPRPGVAKSSPYTGVKWSLRQQMWTVSTKVQGATIHIGVFDDEQEVRKRAGVFTSTLVLINYYCSFMPPPPSLPPPLSRSYLARTPPVALRSAAFASFTRDVPSLDRVERWYRYDTLVCDWPIEMADLWSVKGPRAETLSQPQPGTDRVFD